MNSRFVIREPGYFCQRDEKNFFDWLLAIPGVKSAIGVTQGLAIDVAPCEIDQVGWSDLIGLFARYNVDIQCMRHLDMGTHGDWVRGSKHYWHDLIF